MQEPSASTARLLALLQEQETRAAEVARLLHDDVGQVLSAVGFHLGALGGDQVVRKEIEGHLEHVIDRLREASYKLHSNLVERSGLPLALEQLVGQVRERNPGTKVRLLLQAEKRFPAPIGHAVYRIVEMALDNAVQHSGAALVEVRLSANHNGLSAEVRDNGCGFEPFAAFEAASGIGFLRMDALAHQHDLKLSVTSATGHGTIVSIQTA